ncbi:MAG: magnesium/cobalt transporter CorA [Sphingobacteriales bacterium]|nr:MAG: magnesium/cobalt transporter CorA [Sphingobacteriales bacterium]
MAAKNYLELILNPFDLLRTKKVLHVNPTVAPDRKMLAESQIMVYEYDVDSMEAYELKSVEDCFPFLKTESKTWINVDGLRKEDVEKLCAHFGIHQLITEDILSIGQRPKTDEINGLVFCLLSMLYFNDKDGSVETEQVSIILGKNFVISFQEDASRDVFNPVREKLKIFGSKVRMSNSDFLFYSLIDLIVDNYYIVIEKLGDRIEMLEEDIVRQPNNRSLAKINQLRKEMIVLKRSIAPVREMVGGILRSESELIEERTEKYFKDVYDHIVQATDLAENYRDMMMNLQDLYLSNVNLKLNEVMKVMAIVTCLMAPATVIGGIFGMNFDVMPWLHNSVGFFFAVAVMLIVPIVMLIIFRRRGWF